MHHVVVPLHRVRVHCKKLKGRLSHATSLEMLIIFFRVKIFTSFSQGIDAEI